MQTELSYQAKVLIGTVAALMEDLPEVAKFHFSRVCQHLVEAVMKVEGTATFDYDAAVRMARKDLFTHIKSDPNASPIMKALIELVEMLPDESAEEETPVPLDDIWFHALDEDDDAPTD